MLFLTSGQGKPGFRAHAKNTTTVSRLPTSEPNIEKLRDLLATTRPIYFILGAISILLLLAGTFIFRNLFTMAGNRIDFWITYFLLIPLCYLMIMTIRWSSFMQGLNEIAREARVSTLIEVDQDHFIYGAVIVKIVPHVPGDHHVFCIPGAVYIRT